MCDKKFVGSQLDIFGTKNNIYKESFEIKYKKVLSSSRWKRLKKEFIDIHGYRCFQCEANGYSKKLELHHLNYDHLGKETIYDVALLCTDCHKKEDCARASIQMANNAAIGFNALFKKAWETRRKSIVQSERGLQSGDRESFRRYLFCKYFSVGMLIGDLPMIIDGDYIFMMFKDDLF